MNNDEILRRMTSWQRIEMTKEQCDQNPALSFILTGHRFATLFFRSIPIAVSYFLHPTNSHSPSRSPSAFRTSSSARYGLTLT